MFQGRLKNRWHGPVGDEASGLFQSLRYVLMVGSYQYAAWKCPLSLDADCLTLIQENLRTWSVVGRFVGFEYLQI